MAVKGFNIDWDLIDKRLPTAQVPSAKAHRDILFRSMDSSGNGFITISEAQNGLPALLEKRDTRKSRQKASYLVPIRDLKPAVNLSFAVARKVAPSVGGRKEKRSHDTCVDRREFHALLAAFRAYLELDVIFDIADQDGSRGRLNWKECQKALPLLETWNIDAKQAQKKFPDDWTPWMDYEAFADWCISRRFGHLNLVLDENDAEASIKHEAGNGAISVMLQAFKDWDVDNSGTISCDELANVLMDLDSTFSKDQAMQLFQAADLNRDGSIDYFEFMQWLTK